MNPYVYNGSLLTGILLIAFGCGAFDWRIGLIAAGSLVIGITLFHLKILRKAA